MSKKVAIKKLETGEVEISGEVTTEDFMAYWPAVLTHYTKTVKITGFRPGKAPEKMVVSKVGEMNILLEMAERALAVAYPEIIKDNKIEVAGQPEINLTKIAKNNPLGFSIKVAVNPEFTLPDYKKIAGEIKAKIKDDKPTEVTEQDVETVLKNIQQQKSLSMPENKDIKPEDKDKIVLPEINDDFASSLGDFKTLADLKAKIKENLTKDQELKAKEKMRLSILDALASGTEVTIPRALVDRELEKMLSELKYETSRMGLKFEDYLTHLKKTESELKTAWQVDAEKRVKLGLILNEIIKDAKLTASKEEVETETKHLISHMGEEKPSPENLTRIYSYAENTILHNKAFSLLEE